MVREFPARGGEAVEDYQSAQQKRDPCNAIPLQGETDDKTIIN